MSYSIGSPREPINDRAYEKLEDAEVEAASLSVREDEIYAVWEDGKEKIVSFAYSGAVYRRAYAILYAPTRGRETSDHE